jgi:hypothetical protein
MSILFDRNVGWRDFIYPLMLMLLPNHLHLTRKAIRVSFEFSQYASAAAAHHSAKKQKTLGI